MAPGQLVGLSAWLDATPEDMAVTMVNHTFPPDSMAAVDGLLDIMLSGGYTHVAGVFPANVAAQLGRIGFEFPVLIPVSEPTPAVHGGARGFKFSHWEVF